MPSSTRLVVATCFAAAVLAAACESVPDVVGPPSDLATPPVYPSHIYAASVSGPVRMEAHFTDLRGGIIRDISLLNHVVWLIDNAADSSTIYAAIHNLSANVVQQALQRAASERDVKVYVVMDGSHHPNDPADDSDTSPEDLQMQLDGATGTRFRWCANVPGTATDTATANATDGWNGCIASHVDAIMHSKLLLFSETKDATGTPRSWVAWFGSANLTYHSGADTYNNTITVYGDKTLYDNFVEGYWNRLWAGKRDFPGNDFYDRDRSRGFFPGSTFNLRVFASPQRETDLVHERIRRVEAPGCEIHVAQNLFTTKRDTVARLLAKKKKFGGCLVSVAVRSIDSLPLATLRKANIPVRCINTHDKFILIRGHYDDSPHVRRMVFTGSHNLSYSANYNNDELLVGLEDDDMYTAFRQSWDRMTEDEDARLLSAGDSC